MMKIDFNNLGGPVYSGRPRGESIRSRLALDQVDYGDEVIEVNIPESTYSITSSFFLGLFGPSVLHAGTKDKFFTKYRFQSKKTHQDAIEEYVNRALQAKSLFS